MDREWLDTLGDPAGIDASVLLVVAHPDDETVSAGGLLPRLRRSSLLCVTDGSPASLDDARRAGCHSRRQYARLRAGELHRAASLVGIPPGRVTILGVADQQASLHVLKIAHQLVRRVQDLRPDLLITHAYEGGHPDHDATALAVHIMRALLQSQSVRLPELIEMASYHGAGGGMVTHTFLPQEDCPTLKMELSPDQQMLKRRMMDSHASQQRVLAQFGLRHEAFRIAPRYDFSQPPHAGPLWYEHFDWGMTGPRWRELATVALSEAMPFEAMPSEPTMAEVTLAEPEPSPGVPQCG